MNRAKIMAFLLSRRTRVFGLIILPTITAVIAMLSVFVGIVVASGYKDPGVRYAAIGAVATVGALVVGFMALTVAIPQLFAVERDLSRLTAVNPLVRELRRYTTAGLVLRDQFFDLPNWIDAAHEWVQDGMALIRSGTDEGEASRFLAEGDGLDPRAQILAKVDWVRIDLIPKVIAGYWPPQEDDGR